MAKYAGYNVQDLKTPIALLKDQLFSVVARVFGSEGGRSPSKSSSPQTGDTTADGMPVCALLIILSLAGIVFGQAKDRRFKFIERE